MSDIHNIHVKVHDRLVIHHQDDAQSAYLAFSEQQQEPYNPVMAFKLQGNLDPIHSTLPEDAFLSVIQMEFQRDMYEKYVGRMLCIDSTYGTNAYQYKLITCIVPDHYGQGNFYTIALCSKCTQTMQDNQLLGVFPKEKLQKSLKSFLDAYKNGPLMS